MAPNHLDRLTPVDASFLAQEREGSHMHIGSIMIFEGPPPPREAFLAHIESRLHLVPRYRQKLAFPRFEMGRPLWVDDPRFNIDYHVRHTALPAPGSIEQLRNLAARIYSQRLDRSKPLWEVWLVEGLEAEAAAGATGSSNGAGEAGARRFSLINKTHHCLVDGLSGVDITTVLFDASPEGGDVPEPEQEWAPGPEPSEAQIVAEGVKGLVRTPFGLARQAAGAVSDPGHTVDEVREAAGGVGEVAWSMLNPPPETPLNVPIGPHRRIHWESTRLDDLKAIKNGLGGTVNDVFLTVVSGALGRWLRTRGVRTEGLELRGCVPVSVRGNDEQGDLGNRITMMACPLPVYAEDPRERFQIVSRAMAGLKESKQALGAEVIAGLQEFAPPTIFARASRLNFSSRVYNLLVTNVPGPQFPLYLLGHELKELIPVAFLAPDKALAVAIMSYNGAAVVGLMGDYDAMHDLESFGAYIEGELEELLSIAAESPAPA